MARSHGRGVVVEPGHFWDLTISKWEFDYHFGMAPPSKDGGDDQFSEITNLTISGVLGWPREWSGIEIVVGLHAKRDLAAFLDLTFPPEKLQRPNFPSAYDLQHVGYVRPILRTRLPKEMSADVTLPQDMLMVLLRSLEAGSIRAMHLYSAGETPRDPKTHWIRSVGFQRDCDPDPGDAGS